jgi:hypothetical protein
MLAFHTSQLPLDLRRTTETSISPYQRGPGFGANPWKSGFRGGCGCSPVSGCGCGSGFSGLSQGTSLDSIIASAANWLGGFAQSQLPASAAVAPQYGSTGALMTQLQGWIPYIVIGYLAYKVIR